MTDAAFLGGRVRLMAGDARERVRELPAGTLDAVVTDPPYALVSITKRFGKADAAPAKGDVYARASAGFMGQRWDTGEVAFDPAFWADVRRAMKPGAHLVAFGGTRSYHRLACAIEDAGFEIRDQLAWVYGSGFPKSHSVARALGDQWAGWGTALKPAWEPIVLARNPLAGTVAENVLAHHTGGLNIDGCRVPSGDTIGPVTGAAILGGAGGWDRPWKSDPDAVAARQARADAAVAKANELGRWPANIVHDGSDEVVGLFPSDGEASAARFFYSAKADADDRVASKHPTVKPVDLMQWLVRLVTPPGGLILDPFAGSGTTGEAAWREGFDAILIEREEQFRADIARRMDLADKGEGTRRREIAKANGVAQDPAAIGGLFAGLMGEQA